MNIDNLTIEGVFLYISISYLQGVYSSKLQFSDLNRKFKMYELF